MIVKLKNFKKFYRYPYLKEGDTEEKRDKMRLFLQEQNYRQGYVTIDESDWYIDGRLSERLKTDSKADITSYKNFYLKHIWDRAVFYDDLAKKLYGREIKHTLLIHHSLLNSLFLTDLLQMFKDKGWKLISVQEAFTDQIYLEQAQILPAGESIVWAKAKESGKYNDAIRYPAEDGEFEKAEMDKLGL